MEDIDSYLRAFRQVFLQPLDLDRVQRLQLMDMSKDIDEEDEAPGDPLAVERTAMASERTLLSYVRTAIMLFATAVTLLYVVKDARMIAVGLAVLAASVFTIAFGVWRYRELQKKIASEAHQHPPNTTNGKRA